MSERPRLSRPVLITSASLLGLVAAGVAFLMRPARRPAAADALPLGCRLRRHGWRKPSAMGQPPLRRTCPRCQQIDLRTP